MDLAESTCGVKYCGSSDASELGFVYLEAMLIIQAIPKILFAWIVAGGCVLMAQSAAPQSLTENPDGWATNRASDLGSSIGGSVKNASDSAVSAAVSASVESELSATTPASPQYTGAMQERRLFEGSIRSAKSGSLESQNESMLGALKSQNAVAVYTATQENGSQQNRGLSAGSRIARQQWEGVNRGLADNPFRSRGGALPQKFQRARNLNRSDQGTSDLENGEPNGKGTGFPDSTRGTAPASPPDSGTFSPLDWSPGFAPGLMEFGNTDFLNPSLRVGMRSTGVGKRSRGMRGRRRDALRAQRNGFSSRQPSLLSVSPDQQLEPNALTQPSGSAPLSIDRQLGLQNDLSSGPLDHQ